MLIIYFSYYAFFICIHCVSFLKFHDVVSVGSAIYWHYCVMILIKSKTPTKLCNPWLLCLIIYRLLMILISSLVANSSLSSHKFTYNFIWRLLYFSFYSMFLSLYSWILFFVIHINLSFYHLECFSSCSHWYDYNFNFFHHSFSHYFNVFIIHSLHFNFFIIHSLNFHHSFLWTPYHLIVPIILMLSSFILRISTLKLLSLSWSCMFILSRFIMKWCLIAAMLNNSNSTSTRPSTGMFHIAINRSDKTLGHLCTCRSRAVHIYFFSILIIRHHCFLRFIF